MEDDHRAASSAGMTAMPRLARHGRRRSIGGEIKRSAHSGWLWNAVAQADAAGINHRATQI
jgi:hypothetical protein